MTKYDELLNEIKEKHKALARIYVPALCRALREEDPNLSNEDIHDRVMKDLIEIWSKGTIRNNMPDEFKDLERCETGRKGREKQKEMVVTTNGNVAHEKWPKASPVDENKPKSSTFVEANTTLPVGSDFTSDKQRINELEKQIKELTNAINLVGKSSDEAFKHTPSYNQQQKELAELRSRNEELEPLARAAVHEVPELGFQKASEVKSPDEDFFELDVEDVVLRREVLVALRNANKIVYFSHSGNRLTGVIADKERVKR